MNLPAVIRDLLLTSGSLVVPGLGRLYVKHHPAEMDKSRNVLLPPQQTVQFDERIVSDDGKLSGHLQKRYGLSETLAAKTISGFAESLKQELSEKASATIEGIGRLESGENALSWNSFSPDHPLSAVLPSVEIPGINVKEPFVSRKPAPEPVPVATTVRSAGKSKVWIPVAVIVVIAAIGAALYFTGIADPILQEITGKNSGNSAAPDDNRIVFGKPPVGRDSLQEAISRQLDEKTSKERALSMNEPEAKTAAALPENLQPEPSMAERPVADDPEGPYHIIAGSFKVPANADKYKSQLEKQGFHPVILPGVNTYYMVSLGSYQSLVSAKEAMEQYRSKFGAQLWIMKI
ncbi:MAG: SPOR domain-containing protein [Bacteroidales bacterium]|nr:SPOR domain-containing protein [Bacteroidales bacterium]